MLHDTQYIDSAEIKTQSTAKPGVQQTSRFEFGKLLGSGTFSRVWSAYDRELNCQVAVKHMLKAVDKDGNTGAALERQLQEYRLTKDLCHVNIIRAFDCILTDGDVVIVQELAAAGDLFDTIVPDVGAPMDTVYRVMVQMVSALQYLSDVGIVHRDIKPENIVMDVAGNVKLCDFGECLWNDWPSLVLAYLTLLAADARFHRDPISSLIVIPHLDS